MDRDTERYRSLTRRALILGGVKLGLASALVGRMYFLQVTESERYRVLADENRISMRLLAPSRGEIVDRYGRPLAANTQNFQVIMVAEQAGDVEATLERLSGIVPLTDADRERVLRDVSRRRNFVPVTVRENLTWDQVSQIEVNAPSLPGLSIDVGEIRDYPQGPSTAHLVGYVGAVSEEELTGDPVLTLPGFRIGKTGIERQLESTLRGVAGTRQVEVNATGRIIRELSRDEGTRGEEVRSTIDVGLQDYVQDRLAEERSASAVIMDVHTGEVYAMASSPSFNPNIFATGIDGASWRSLINDQYAPLTNKALAGQYAPGSTFKMITALTAIENGIAGPNHSVFCPGHMDLGNHRFHCWRRGGHGWLTLVDALAESCDTYFYDLSRRVGVDRLSAMANRFGLGTSINIDLPGERQGLVPTQDWKRQNVGTAWQQGETLIAAIGQGYVLATPLQLAVMTARLVNGGRAIDPRVVMRNVDPNESVPDIGISERGIRAVVDGMIAVTDGSRGTARSSQIPVEGMEMGGKTGTSQVRRITMAQRAQGLLSQDEIPWRDRHHALFVGFAPMHRPRYACSVVVEHGGGGSAVAAPIARDLLWEAQKRNPASDRIIPVSPPGVAAAGEPGDVGGTGGGVGG
ncbi:penicillin-binding protein 2 [Fodinicurvata sp. EGI_FJ10296]|uniref:penicillin-binding protein 2 n=1 Tax=Fodinicurvata sp. EGI_FJ10296 TaxID=3231908 RepID=UPI0034573214